MKYLGIPWVLKHLCIILFMLVILTVYILHNLGKVIWEFRTTKWIKFIKPLFGNMPDWWVKEKASNIFKTYKACYSEMFN